MVLPTLKINDNDLYTSCLYSGGEPSCKRTDPNSTSNNWKAPSDSGCHVFPISASWVEPAVLGGNFCCGWHVVTIDYGTSLSAQFPTLQTCAGWGNFEGG